MNAKEAVALRIKQLCNERNIALNNLANLSGVSSSTIYSIMKTYSKNPGTVTIQKLCDGFGITLREFFNSDIFENIEQEIR